MSTTTRPRRAALALASGALLATMATACEPPPPPAAFTVVPTATGADADPGDGTCATAAEDCSLQAAVEEANALAAPTEITVPAGTVAAADVEVTGSIELMGTGWPDASAVSWTIAEGAQLAATDIALGPVATDGTFLARRVGLGGTTAPVSGVAALVEVSPTGSALLTNTVAVAWGAPLLANEGTAVVFATTVMLGDPADGAAITTATGGDTRLSATAFIGGNVGADPCAGVAPTSYGYNLAPDTSCGLTMTGDRQDFVSFDLDPPIPPDVRVDAIPVGTLHCGAGWTDDVAGEGVRPFDGDQSGTAACDIGAQELRPS